MTYDLVVVGLGGMGSAALARAALRGRRVLGVEQFARGHQLGASSGRSRIIRKAYFEDPAYVPLLHDSYALWHDLEARTGARVLDLFGILMVGDERSDVIAAVASTARAHDLTLEDLDVSEMLRRYPQTRPRTGEVGLLERDAGAVFPEAAVAAHLALAEAHGAETRFETAVVAYEPRPDGIVVRLVGGENVVTSRLALCAGPWLAQVAPDLPVPLAVQRNVQIWFTPSRTEFTPDRLPAFFVDRADWPAPLYGFPDLGDGVKAALHKYGRTTAPNALDREIHDEDIAAVRRPLDEWLPGAAAQFAFGKACMYTLTPDEHFLIDRHPADPRIVVAGGFSGHGFKFCPVVGEIVAELAFDGTTTRPISFLRIDRFEETIAR